MKRKLLVVLLTCAMLSSCGVNNVGNNGTHIKNGDSEVSIGKDGITAKNGDSEANLSAEGVKVQNGLDLEGEDPVTKEKRKNNIFLDEDKIKDMELKENDLDKDDIKNWEIKLDKRTQ